MINVLCTAPFKSSNFLNSLILDVFKDLDDRLKRLNL